MIVVDASIIVHLIAEAEPLANPDILYNEDSWIAPAHVDLEVLNALRRYVMLKRLTVTQATAAVGDYMQLALERHSVASFITRIWELRDNLSPYDGAYIGLAESRGIVVVTRDEKLASASGHHAKVIVTSPIWAR